MPDICMCERNDCPSRLRCYRYTATPDPLMQSYFAPPYPPIVDGKCSEYWQLVEEEGKV